MPEGDRDYSRPAAYDPELDYASTCRIARAHDVFACCLRAGWDAEDLLHEVVVRVIARQAMESRYRPERAPLGVYLYVLTRGILMNLLAKETARARAHAALAREVEVTRQSDAALEALEEHVDVVRVVRGPRVLRRPAAC